MQSNEIPPPDPSFSFGVCVHTNPPVASTSDQYLAKAAVISDRLDAKAVVVTEWLKSH